MESQIKPYWCEKSTAVARIEAYLQHYEIPEINIAPLTEEVLKQVQQLQQLSAEIQQEQYCLPTILEATQQVLNKYLWQQSTTQNLPEEQVLLAIHVALLCWHRMDQRHAALLNENETAVTLQMEEMPVILLHPTPPIAPLNMVAQPFEFYPLYQPIKTGFNWLVRHFKQWWQRFLT